MDNFSRCTGVETTNSANSIADHKTPDAGILQVPKRDWLYATSSATLAAIESRLGSQTWKGAHTGRFSCSRCYERDSTAPLRPAIDRGGFGICESLSQRDNYLEIIRLARRNHKPGGADLAGSVHVVRSLSG